MKSLFSRWISRPASCEDLEKVRLSQPAVSADSSRLLDVFDDEPGSPPKTLRPPPRSVWADVPLPWWPTTAGMACYPDTTPTTVWDPDPGPAPDRIVVGSGRG